MRPVGEGGVADGPERKRDERRDANGDVRDGVPALLVGVLHRVVDEEGVVVAHESERHDADGRHQITLGESPAVGHGRHQRFHGRRPRHDRRQDQPDEQQRRQGDPRETRHVALQTKRQRHQQRRYQRHQLPVRERVVVRHARHANQHLGHRVADHNVVTHHC